MKNEIFHKFKDKIKIQITGKNYNRFIRKLVDKKIDILDIKYKKNSIEILINKSDYKKVKEIKSTYEIKILGYEGIIKIKEVISINKFLIIFTIMGILLLLYLSNTIFDVKVIHNDINIRNMLKQELEENDIIKGKPKKSYENIQKIKKKILEKYKDEIEWLEIEEVGTTYIVRVQERIINKTKKDNNPQNVISKKVAIIKKIIAERGDVVKEINNYVNPGDIIISGEIKLNEETKNYVGAKGNVYGEVWYTTNISYPLAYSEKKETGKKKNVYVLKILNKEYELTLKKFNDKNKSELVILKNNFIPVMLVKQYQKEIKKTDFVATIEEAMERAEELGREKIKSKLKEDEYIISEKQLKLKIKDSKIELEMFYSVYENITDYRTIVEE